jgi:GNAT superfamily N-acetyltransferase
VKIRRAQEIDVRGIANVLVKSWRTTYKGIVSDQYLNNLSYQQREENWRANLTSTDVFVAESDEGEIVGFSSGGKERSALYPGYDGELYAIYILKAYQNKGLGKRLIHPIVEGLRNQGIEGMLVLVLQENPSRHFYEALGAKWLDTIEVEIGEKPLLERVYGWADISRFPD